MTWLDKLLPLQREAFDFIVKRHAACLFAEQRTGKTYVTNAVLEALSGELDDVLIIAPLTSLDTVWAKSLPEVLPGHVLCRSWGEYRPLRNKKRCVLLIHFQLFTKISKQLAKTDWGYAIIDESQGLKARNSGWSRAARRLRHSQRRLALSGTPIDESPIDVWAQMRFVDHAVFGEDWTSFAESYCMRGGFKNKKWTFRPSRLPDFLAKLEPYCFRLTKSQMGFQPVTLHLVPVPLLGPQETIYRTMQEHGLVRVGDHKIKAPRAITKKGKLEQITGGHVLDEDEEPVYVGSAKQRKLRWLLTKITRPLVVFCKYTHELRDILAIMRRCVGENVAALDGSVRGDERTQLIEDFQAGRYDALVCQLRTGGVSIDLSRADHMVFYSMNHSYIDFEQVISRLDHVSRNTGVNVWLLYAEDTVDEEIIDVVRKRKRESVREVVGHFEKEKDMAEMKLKEGAVKKTAAKKAVKKAVKKTAKSADAPKFTVEHAAKKLGITETTARLKFREAGIKKPGRSYGWESEAAMMKDIKPLMAA